MRISEIGIQQLIFLWQNLDFGVDMLLLDDGWFGNKYPRKDDHAGLGDWVIEQPNRDTYYYRNQLVLDLSNPKVQDYV